MIGRFWAALLAAFLMTTPALSADLSAPDVEAWLHGLMSYGLESGDIAGSVVVVVKDGKVLFQSGYGYADVAKKTPMDADRTSNWRVRST